MNFEIRTIANFLMFTIFQSFSIAIAQSSIRLQVIEKEIVVSSSIDGTVVSELDLGTLQLGTVNRTIIVLSNRLKDPIEFLEASVGCSCISANVPKVKIVPGGKERMVFDLSVGGSERKTAKDFEIELRTTGAIDRILIKLSAKIAGVVVLGVESMLHELSSANVDKNEAALKRVQIITSDIALIRDATVKVSENLQEIISPRIIIGVDRAFLELSMLRRPPSTGKLVGEVFLTGPAFSKCVLELSIREKPLVELCPNYLVFGSTNNATVSATSIVRVNAKKPVNEADSISVTCTLPSGKLLESRFSKLSNDIYRVELEIQKSVATEFRSTGVDIEMRFKSSTLDELVVGKSRFVW